VLVGWGRWWPIVTATEVAGIGRCPCRSRAAVVGAALGNGLVSRLQQRMAVGAGVVGKVLQRHPSWQILA
jgi:hypothetical protein